MTHVSYFLVRLNPNLQQSVFRSDSRLVVCALRNLLTQIALRVVKTADVHYNESQPL